MDDILVFRNDAFGEVRVADIDSKPMFAATDVARALGYQNPAEAIATHCKTADIAIRYVPHRNSLGGTNVQYISESNVYRLVMRSKLPQAEQFQDWVCDEVLPTIRKSGMYATPDTVEKMIDNPDFAIKLLENLKEERKKRLAVEAERDTMRPKALFADAVVTSDRSCLVSEMAKILKQNSVEIGQNRLFEWLRQNGYLCSKGEYYNMPTQRAVEMGLFEIKKTTVTKPDGSVLVTATPKITGKGQIYFVNKFLAHKMVQQKEFA